MSAMTVEGHLASVDSGHRDDVRRVHELIRDTAPELAVEVGEKMLGYGPFHYRYASGREGDSHLISLASRKQYISLYVNCVTAGTYLAEQFKERLPKANIGRSCVRFKRVDDLDADALRELVRTAADAGPAGNA